MRDVNNGWLIRYLHANTASAFFFLVYLHIGRGMYYGSYQRPRTLTWAIGTIILVAMMATAFLGYLHSPKWFNINISFLYVLLNIFLYILYIIKRGKIEDKSKKGHKVKQLKYNVNKGLYNKISLLWVVKDQHGHRSSLRKYSSNCSANNSLDISDRLKEIIKELDLNPVYIFENLNLENTKKQILNDTRGLSGIYIIINKITKDYYIGSAATNRFYSRFSNHLIYFRGSKIVKLVPSRASRATRLKNII